MSNEVKILVGLGGLTLAAVVALAVFFGGSSSTSTPSTANLVPSDAYQTGPSSAKVTVVEFADFQCPACAAAEPTVRQLRTDYQGRVNFVFRHFPLPAHANAQVAAEAGEAAGAQGKFWEMYDLLYEKQSEWATSGSPTDLFVTYAKSLGLDTTKFKSDVDNYQYITKVRRDQSDGQTLGVNATPTFFINGEKRVGVIDLTTFKSILDGGLSK